VPTSKSFTTAKRKSMMIGRVRPTTTPAVRLISRSTIQPFAHSAGKDLPAPDGAVIAPCDELGMVPGVSIIEGIGTSEQLARVGRLGAILSDDVIAEFDPGDESSLAFLAGRRRPEPPPFLEVGPVTRKHDEDGRFKVILDAGPLCEILAWGAGSLEVTAVDGWVVLRQRPDLVGVSAVRHASNASVSRDTKGQARIRLKQAHLDELQLGPDCNVLVIPLVDAGCLALVNPSVVMTICPPLVTQILADAFRVDE